MVPYMAFPRRSMCLLSFELHLSVYSIILPQDAGIWKQQETPSWPLARFLLHSCWLGKEALVGNHIANSGCCGHGGPSSASHFVFFVFRRSGCCETTRGAVGAEWGFRLIFKLPFTTVFLLDILIAILFIFIMIFLPHLHLPHYLLFRYRSHLLRHSPYLLHV